MKHIEMRDCQFLYWQWFSQFGSLATGLPEQYLSQWKRRGPNRMFRSCLAFEKVYAFIDISKRC